MTLKEILGKCKGLEVIEERYVSSEYCELVFLTKDIDKWNNVFSNILGSEIKPAGVESTANDLELTKNHGGVYKNQTLFKKDFGDTSIMVMFWPWSNNVYTTLKLLLIKEENDNK